MKQITQTIALFKYGYTPGEFLPIMSGDQLLNKKQFIAYKARCLLLKRSLI